MTDHPLARRRSRITFDELLTYLEGETERAHKNTETCDDEDKQVYDEIVVAYNFMATTLLLAYDDVFGTLMHILETISPEEMKNRVIFEIAQRLEESLDRCADLEREHGQRYVGCEALIESYVDDLLARQFV